jgi:hypothetical protein
MKVGTEVVMKLHQLLFLVLIGFVLIACSAEVTQPISIPTDDYAHLGLSSTEAATLLSLEQVDDHPLYTMTYYAEYDSLTTLSDVRRVAAHTNNVTWACSLFSTFANPDSMLYGRNFDWVYSPALLLFTDPADGFASVSMVDIAYLGYDDPHVSDLTEQPLDDLMDLLFAPYLPFDGLNEQGLAIGMAAVPPGDMAFDSSKPTISNLGVIREILDHAATVDEAVEIIAGVNIDHGETTIHYLIADASGKAALVEFIQGEMWVVENENPWHQATNFWVSPVQEKADGFCPRYDTLTARLTEQNGSLTMDDAMDLLQDVSQESTMWSIIYGMSTGEVQVAMRLKYDQVHQFTLELAE